MVQWVPFLEEDTKEEDEVTQTGKKCNEKTTIVSIDMYIQLISTM